MKKILALIVSLFCVTSWAQSWPNQTVRMIVPAAVGSGPDLQARYLAEQLKSRWSQNVIVENHPGPMGLTGMNEFIRTKGNSHVILYTFFSSIVSNDFLVKNLPYNYKTDLDPVVQVSDVEMIWSVPANSRIQNMQDLINLARSKEVLVAVTNKWVAQHTILELVNLQANTNLVPVFHKSAPQAGTSLLSESVEVLIDTVSTSSSYARAGKSRIIAVSTARRSAQWPQVPTVGETLPGFVMAPYNAIFVHRGTSRDIVNRINRDVNEILAAGVPQTVFENPQGGTPEKLAQQIEKDRVAFGRLVKRFNIQPE